MRLVCFGDSFTATAGVAPEAIAAGCVPSWIDLLSERWGCEYVTRGANGVGPLEMLHQIQNFGEFLPGDRVFCAFSRVRRFCLSPEMPSIHHYTDLPWEPAGSEVTAHPIRYIRKELGLKEMSSTELSRIVQAHRWYELFLNNEYREQILHYAVFTALDGIAAANPQAKFYVKYCFNGDWKFNRAMNLQNKFFKLLEGDLYSICGEEERDPKTNQLLQRHSNVTNHFTADAVGDFVNYLDEAMT